MEQHPVHNPPDFPGHAYIQIQ